MRVSTAGSPAAVGQTTATQRSRQTCSADLLGATEILPCNPAGNHPGLWGSSQPARRDALVPAGGISLRSRQAATSSQLLGHRRPSLSHRATGYMGACG